MKNKANKANKANQLGTNRIRLQGIYINYLTKCSKA